MSVAIAFDNSKEAEQAATLDYPSFMNIFFNLPPFACPSRRMRIVLRPSSSTGNPPLRHIHYRIFTAVTSQKEALSGRPLADGPRRKWNASSI